MSDTALGDLTATASPTSADTVYLVQGSTSKQTSLGNASKGVMVTNLDVTGLTASQLLRVNSGGTAVESSGKTVPTGDIVGTSDTQTLTNKTIATASNTITNAAADGSTKGIATFAAADFDASSGVISIDYTNGQKATTGQAGLLTEIATAAETTTGTDAARAVSPDGLAGSTYGKRFIAFPLVASDTAVTTGDGTNGIPITSELNGYNIVDVQANVYTKGITGTTDIQIRRQRGASDADVLTDKVTIGDEYYAADGSVNTSNDDLVTGDMLFVDVDAIHSGTAPNGLSVVVVVQLP